MTPPLSLAALDGRSPLGFLAALGLLRLVSEHGNPNARLSWMPGSCTAHLHNAHSSIDDLAAHLQQIVDSIPTGGVLPDTPPDFPPASGDGPDKLRLTRPRLRAYAATLDRELHPQLERWLCSMVTDLSLDGQDRGRISLFAAPSGQQSMRTMLEQPLTAIRENPSALDEALRGWRRYPGVTGEYLDHSVLVETGDTADGRSGERGVPGATWLALMAYPLLLTATGNGQLLTSGWQPATRPGYGPRMVYPLWSAAVDVHGAAALLTHPILASPEIRPGAPPDAARAASIFVICAAERRRIRGRTFAGVLTPLMTDPLGSPVAESTGISRRRRWP